MGLYKKIGILLSLIVVLFVSSAFPQNEYSLPGCMWDEIAGAALIDPSIITGQKSLYMDIDVDHGASYSKTIFCDAKTKVPPYVRLANVQFDIDAEKFYKIYMDLMTRAPRP